MKVLRENSVPSCFGRVSLCLLTLGIANSSFAGTLPLWELGAGLGAISFPDYRGSDERSSYLLPIPYFIYRGEKLKVARDSVSGRLLETEKFVIDLSLNGSVPVDSDDNEARAGMPDLDPTLEFGPILKVPLLVSAQKRRRLDFRLPVRAIITSDLEHIGWIAQPQLNLDIASPLGYEGWRLGLVAGPLFGDEEYHDYFYGVTPQFARPGRPAYSADGGYAGTQLIAALSKRYPRFWVGGFVKWDTLDGAVFEDSPLIRDESFFTGGIAISWIFKVSETQVERKEVE